MRRLDGTHKPNQSSGLVVSTQRWLSLTRMTIPDVVPSFHFVCGTLPVLLSIPHAGTHIPEALRGDYTDVALQLADTDWHLHRLYAFAHSFRASVLQATHSRSVIDLNRPPDDQSLYPGRITTGLCPTEIFRGEAIYRAGRASDATQTARRLALYWRPYHDALAAELDRLKSLHGHVLLWDAHSIASQLPRLFDGKLPDLNLGTADGASCAAQVLAPVVAIAQDSGFSAVVNGRFKRRPHHAALRKPGAPRARNPARAVPVPVHG